MTLTKILSLSRGFLDDNALPYSWSNDELVEDLNKSINELCEKAELLLDSTTEAICKITITKDLAKYALDERIINIKRARLITYDKRITKRTAQYMDRYYNGWDMATAGSGTPTCFLEDINTGYIHLVPTPDANDVLWLTVSRLPLLAMDIATPDASPEIKSRYHFELLDGILWRAYSKQDTETYDPKKAANHFGLWQATLNTRMLEIINRNDIDNAEDQIPDYLDD